MVNCHPIAVTHGELSPHHSFSHGKISPLRSFSQVNSHPMALFLMVNSHPMALFLVVNSQPIALFLMVISHLIAPFLMVNSHPIALSHGELSPHRTFFFIIFDVFFLLCDTDSKQAGWNQSATNSCKKGTNIPFNQDTWHKNDCIKQGIKSLGPSVTENAVQRLSHTKSPLA